MITTMASDRKDIRLLLVGLTGSGKSSTGNTLVGTDCFKAGHGSKSETFKCKQGTMEWNGSKVQVMDSPGLFDTKKSHEEIADQVVQALFELKPGPHAFLYVVSSSQRYTEEQYNAYKRLKEYLGDQIQNFTIVVFTHGDSIKAKGMTLDTYIEKDNLSDELASVVNECGRRCILFDNKAKDKKPQVEGLMTMIDILVKGNGNQHYKDTFPPGNVSGALRERIKKAEEEELKKKQHVIELKRKEAEAERQRKLEELARLKAEKEKAEAEKKKKEAEKAKAEAERQRKLEEEAKLKAEKEKAEAEKKKKEAEKAKAEAERQRKLEEEAKLKAEKEKAEAEKKKKEAEKAKAEAERQRKLEEEAKLKAEKEKAEAEKKKKEAEKAKAEAERQRKLEEEAKLKAENEKAEAEQKQKEAEKEKGDLEEKVKKDKEEREKKRKERQQKLKVAKAKEDEAETLRNQAKAQFIFALPTFGLSTIKAKDRVNRAKELEREAAQIREEYKEVE